MNYSTAIDILLAHGYRVGKRTLRTINEDMLLMDLFVEVSPVLISDKIADIQSLLPEFDVQKDGVGLIAVVKN